MEREKPNFDILEELTGAVSSGWSEYTLPKLWPDAIALINMAQRNLQPNVTSIEKILSWPLHHPLAVF